MLNSKTISALCSAISALVLTSCSGLSPGSAFYLDKKDTPVSLSTNAIPSSPSSESMVLKPHVHLIDDQSKSFSLKDIKPDRLIFSKTNGAFKIGDVLMGRVHGIDFLRRVRQIDEKVEQTVLETETATLFDAFEKLDVSSFRSDDTIKGIHPFAHPITLNNIRVNIGGIADIVTTLTFQPDFSDVSLKLKGSKLSVRVVPKSKILCDLRTEFSLFSDPSRLANSIPMPALKPIGKVSFDAVTIPGWIGPVPIVFHVTPAISLDWGSLATGKMVLGTDIAGDVQAGIELEAERGHLPTYQTFKNYQFQATLKDPSFELTGAVRLKLNIPEVQTDTQIAGIVGPYVKVGSYVDGKIGKVATVTSHGTVIQGSAQSDLGLGIEAGITETTLFGHHLANGIHVPILDKTIKELYRKDFRATLPPPGQP